MTPGEQSWPCCKGLQTWPTKTANAPWTWRISSCFNCERPKNERGKPRPRPRTFAIAPPAPRHGSSASTTKSSKCSFQRKSATHTACRGNEVLTIPRSRRTRARHARLWLRSTRNVARLVSAPMALAAPDKRGPWFALGALACLVLPVVPAAAIVGGAPFADRAIAQHVVLIVGGHSLCSGVAIAPDLVLTAAHCVLSNGKYRLLAFEGRRERGPSPAVLATGRCPRPRSRQTCAAAGGKSRARHVQRPPGAAFGGRPVHRRGLRCRGARRWQDRGQAACGHAGRNRPA